MRRQTIAYLIAFVLVSHLLPSEGLSGQHSLCVQTAPQCVLALSTGNPGLFQAGLRSQLDERFALFGPFFASLSFGSFLASPSAYSSVGLRYRGYSSVFASAGAGAVLPGIRPQASVELGAALHAASWTSTKLMFAFMEINGAFRLRDPAEKPFYAGWARNPDGSGGLRAELTLPFSVMILSDSCAVSLGLGIGIRRDSLARGEERESP